MEGVCVLCLDGWSDVSMLAWGSSDVLFYILQLDWEMWFSGVPRAACRTPKRGLGSRAQELCNKQRPTPETFHCLNKESQWVTQKRWTHCRNAGNNRWRHCLKIIKAVTRQHVLYSHRWLLSTMPVIKYLSPRGDKKRGTFVFLGTIWALCLSP